MALTRREMIGLGIAAVLWPMAQPALAHQFVNRSGLAPGQFVWEPSHPPHGPVVIVVSPADRIVHVYKGGALIGISTCDLQNSRDRKVVGVFWLDGRTGPGGMQESGAVIDSRDLMWSGRALYGEHLRAAFGRVTLPTPFARLLSDVTREGALLIVASQRTEPFEATSAGDMLPKGTVTASADSANPARVSPATLRLNTDIDGTALVISRASRTAVLVRDGIPVKRLRVRFTEQRRQIGTQVFSLTKPDRDGASQWLGFGIGRSVAEFPRGKWPGRDVLSQISFEDRAAGAAIMRELHIGSPTIVMDAPLTGSARRPPNDQVILAAQSAKGPPQAQARTAQRGHSRSRKPNIWAGFLPHGIN